MGIKEFLKKKDGGLAAQDPSKDMVPFRGYFNIKHLRDGKVLSEQDINNTVVYVGKYLVMNNMMFASVARANYMALGSDSTAAAVGQSLLIAELDGSNASGGQRVQCSVAAVNVSAPSGITDTAQFYYSFSPLQSMQIQEVGIFNLSGKNNGQMVGRQTVTAINAQSGDTVNVTYKFQF